jgi:response regulator of citrate/malate metabolism
MAEAHSQCSSGSAQRGSSMTLDFSALLDSMRTTGGEGMTTAEICDELGCSALTARRMIAKAIDDGKVRVTHKMGRRIDGKPAQIPSYVILESEMEGA